MNNLNKENFWNEMYQKYPLAMKDFCEWVDQYTDQNNWKELFNSDSDWQDANGKNAPAPKFHELPIAMQMGIWNEYIDCDSILIDKCKINIETFLSATEEGMEQLKSMREQ